MKSITMNALLEPVSMAASAEIRLVDMNANAQGDLLVRVVKVMSMNV